MGYMGFVIEETVWLGEVNSRDQGEILGVGLKRPKGLIKVKVWKQGKWSESGNTVGKVIWL